MDFATIARDALARIAAGGGRPLSADMAAELCMDQTQGRLIAVGDHDVAVAVADGGFRVAVIDYETDGVYAGLVVIDG